MSLTTTQFSAGRDARDRRMTDAPGEQGVVSLSGVLHALRRRWLLILLVGTPLAIVCGGLLAWLLPVHYEAVAELHVQSHEDRLLPALDARNRGQYDSTDYDIFRQTQASLMTSAFVLNAVLRDPEIQRLSMLDEEQVPNPVGFLQDHIKTTYPNDAEVLRVSMRGENPEELKKLVDAVTDAYLNETVFKQRVSLRERANKLSNEYAKARDEIRQTRETIHTREIQLGAKDPTKPYIRHQLELEKLRNLEDARQSVESRIHEIDLKRALAQAAENNPAEVDVPEYMIAEELERDSQYMRLKSDLDLAQQQYSVIAAAARANSPSLQRAASQTQVISQQLDARRRQLRRRIEQKVLDEAAGDGNDQASLTMLKSERDILQKRLDKLTKAHDDQLAYVNQLDGFSARLETDREELAYAVKLNQARNAEIHDIQVQLESPERIQKIQSATIPYSNSHVAKILQVICAAIAVFGLSAVGIVGWDLSGRRINSTREAAVAAGAPVLGKIPRLHGSWSLRGPSRAFLDGVVEESVDSIRTALVRDQEDGGRNTIILLTSALGGEGKSTLAGHLAVSLSRAGKRIVLVDADTRNPQQHLVFGVDGGRGFCDGLRAGADIDEYSLPTGYEGLSLLPAGRPDAASHKALANDVVESCLKELSANYDFVVIDAGPVLTNAEPLILGRHCDAVVLSVLRDTSQTAKVEEAVQRLRAVGVELAGVVVHGGAPELRRSGMMQSNRVAQTGQAAALA